MDFLIESVTDHGHELLTDCWYSVGSWWRHQIFSVLLAICAGNSPVTGEFPTQRPVTRSLDIFFDLRLNKRLSKQSWGWWFETPSRPLWRHCHDNECRQLTTAPQAHTLYSRSYSMFIQHRHIAERICFGAYILIRRGLVTPYGIKYLGHRWCRYCAVTCSVPIHYMIE